MADNDNNKPDNGKVVGLRTSPQAPMKYIDVLREIRALGQAAGAARSDTDIEEKMAPILAWIRDDKNRRQLNHVIFNAISNREELPGFSRLEKAYLESAEGILLFEFARASLENIRKCSNLREQYVKNEIELVRKIIKTRPEVAAYIEASAETVYKKHGCDEPIRALEVSMTTALEEAKKSPPENAATIFDYLSPEDGLVAGRSTDAPVPPAQGSFRRAWKALSSWRPKFPGFLRRDGQTKPRP